MDKSKLKPTPGKWMTDGTVNGFPWTVHVVQKWEELGPSNGKIATCEDVDGNFITRVANAKLISAAPDLLSACEKMLEILCGPLDDLDIDAVRLAVHAGRKALQKADGY